MIIAVAEHERRVGELGRERGEARLEAGARTRGERRAETALDAPLEKMLELPAIEAIVEALPERDARAVATRGAALV